MALRDWNARACPAMAIARGAVLVGHVIGPLLQTLAVLVLVVGVSLAMGFRSAAGPLARLAIAGSADAIRLR